MWDLGMKTGNFPAIRIDDLWEKMGGFLKDKITPSAKEKITRAMVEHFSKGEIDKVISVVEKLRADAK